MLDSSSCLNHNICGITCAIASVIATQLGSSHLTLNSDLSISREIHRLVWNCCYLKLVSHETVRIQIGSERLTVKSCAIIFIITNQQHVQFRICRSKFKSAYVTWNKFQATTLTRTLELNLKLILRIFHNWITIQQKLLLDYKFKSENRMWNTWIWI